MFVCGSIEGCKLLEGKPHAVGGIALDNLGVQMLVRRASVILSSCPSACVVCVRLKASEQLHRNHTLGSWCILYVSVKS